MIVCDLCYPRSTIQEELKVTMLFHMFDINLRSKPSECMNMWGTSQNI